MVKRGVFCLKTCTGFWERPAESQSELRIDGACVHSPSVFVAYLAHSLSKYSSTHTQTQMFHQPPDQKGASDSAETFMARLKHNINHKLFSSNYCDTVHLKMVVNNRVDLRRL